MPHKRFTTEQTAIAPRQPENGSTVDEVCRKMDGHCHISQVKGILELFVAMFVPAKSLKMQEAHCATRLLLVSKKPFP
ncbi:hypothetical protein [Methylobacterium frigidaeris]|uniref:Uncharacterized protein n=1 Tax=Methylobacterium frigidaeris TaxID=2038277 RepID=A0AA37HIN2_9HYPH|nr:hypothetical protein [Methylobacterium frigidaeris]GJD66710.1 hypothetical protein MPEAHAMD_6908 [Methylobacterium frigidaeris]